MTDDRGEPQEAAEMAGAAQPSPYEGLGELYVVGERLPPPGEVRDPAVAVGALLTALGGLTFAGGLLLGAPMTVYGLGLAVGLLSFAVSFRRYFGAQYPDIEAVEPREPPGQPEEADGPDEPDEEDGQALVGVRSLRRRSVLGWLLAGGAGLLGISLLAPVTSLGPRHEGALRRTSWAPGLRMVTSDGHVLRPRDIDVGSVATVWPEGHIGDERAAVLVLRLSDRGALDPTNRDWVVDDALVAYSKICTHAGCPVGLFRERDDALFCPCHQATFDAGRAAEPTLGPAARRLPQLPMSVDDDGFLIALDDFPEQVGPGFGWLPRASEAERAHDDEDAVPGDAASGGGGTS